MNANALFFSLFEGVITALAAESGVIISFFLLEEAKLFFLMTGVEGVAMLSGSACDCKCELAVVPAGVPDGIGRLTVYLTALSTALLPLSPRGGSRMNPSSPLQKLGLRFAIAGLLSFKSTANDGNRRFSLDIMIDLRSKARLHYHSYKNTPVSGSMAFYIHKQTTRADHMVS